MPPNKLKILRHKRNLTVRQVEQASRRIAAAIGDKRFGISNGWLAQLEHGVSIPNPCAIFSLCAIYCVSFAELLAFYGVDIYATQQYEHIANPQLTRLIPTTSVDGAQPGLSLVNTLSKPATSLITAPSAMDQKRRGNEHIRYGYIGLNDDTMYPLIRPGAVVEIDTRQNKVPPASKLTSQFEKPIFFVELRDGYAFGWCTIQRKKLVITPHPSSRTLQRNFDYPREADIVGRVVGYTTRCVDSDEMSK